MPARVRSYSWQLGSVYHSNDRLCNARAIKNSFFSLIFINSARMRAQKMEQLIHFVPLLTIATTIDLLPRLA